MNFLLGLVKDSKFVAALGLIVIITLVFVLGAIFKIPWMIRIIVVVFIVLLFLIFFLYKKMKDAQKAGQIEKSISSSESGSLSPEKRAEIDQFKKQLEAAIISLKNSKLGRGKLGKSALYALPWYMIIGPSAAGKTTAIQNSGLEFPFGKDALKGVGGTRNCDWFFATKAIFLDTAGRYITQTEDRAEWIAFLETLKKNRKKKPINGVVVALNVDEIINSDKDSLYGHAKNIRSRIDELIENLKIVFPVYFVFTKCDLIQGFVEYFGDFSEIERAQIWGSTLTSVQQLDPDPKSVFESEFKKLSDLIYKIRTVRLSNPLKREQRRKVFLFPYQFKSLQDKLTYLIGEVFQPNPYQDNPIFRGFYFTSGTQEGAPLDLAIKEIAKRFNLPTSSTDEEQEILETKNYFIKDLMNEVVIPDQNFSTGQATSVIRQNKNLRLAVVSFSAALLILLGLLAFIGFSGSSSALDKISVTADSFTKINWSGDLLSNFGITDRFISLIDRVDNGDVVESFTSFGLDQSDETSEHAKQLFLKNSKPFFKQNIYDELTKNLRNYSAGQDYPGEQIYNYLKSYLLLTSEKSRMDSSGQKFLASVFISILNRKFIDSNPAASASEKDSLRILLKNYCDFTAKLIEEQNEYSFEEDDYLISSVRNKFRIKPSSESIYARMKEYGRSQYPSEISFEQVIGGRFSQVVSSDFKIPYLFTRDGWDVFFKKAILEESQNPGKEDWVLGKRQVNNPTLTEFDSEKLKKDLFEIYINDYKQNWVWFLQSLKYPGFETVPLAANSLKIFSDPVNSPLILIFKLFADETKFIVDLQQSADTGKSGTFTKAAYGSAAIFDIKRMRKFILGPEDGSALAELNAVIAQYGLVSGTTETIKGGSDLSKDYAVNVLNQRAVELPTALQLIRGSVFNTPEFQSMFVEPIRLTWYAILNDAAQYLNLQWKVKVVDMFNRGLAESFPFNVNGADAPLQDFSDFFRPQTGTLWSFFNDELSAFINKDRWKPNLWENQGIAVSNQLLNSLKKADEISSVMFKGGEVGITFRMKPQLPVSKTVGGKKPTVVQVYIRIDGSEETYKMGSAFWSDYTWPGSSGMPGARMNITLSDFGTSDTKSFDGEWSLFRLLSSASSVRAETSSQYIFNWNFQNPNLYDVTVTYTIGASSSRNPFAANFFKSFRLTDKIN
jgi:type VI secretion system protein ImpL